MDLFSRAFHYHVADTAAYPALAEGGKMVEDVPTTPPHEEQLGGGYSLRPNIKTTSLATPDDALVVQNIANMRMKNPDYVPAPEISSYSDGAATKKAPPLTGWEDVTQDQMFQYTSSAIDADEISDTGAPDSPTPRRHPRSAIVDSRGPDDDATLDRPSSPESTCSTNGGGRNDDANDGNNVAPEWGWDGDGEDTKPSKGRRSNVVRTKIDNAFQEIRMLFRQVADETGCPVSTLHSEFHSRHSFTTSTSDWRVYESYFKENKEAEIARHKDQDGLPVPDATARDCWTTFKLLPNHRQILSVFRELSIASREQTVRQRRRTFDRMYKKFCSSIDLAYEENFEVCIWMVGGCVNEDTSLAAHYCTPGLAELASRLGTTTDEITTFAKVEAYRVRGEAASKEIIDGRNTATKSEVLATVSAGTTSTVATVENEDSKQEKPMNADTIRYACKNAIFDMFNAFGQPLTKPAKGKGKANDSNASQMPWSTLPGLLGDMGIQLHGWPWEVEPPSKNSTQGIKVLPTAAARLLLSALLGETMWKPYLKRAEKPEDLRSNKVPVIFTVGPPHESQLSNGHVVFANGTWVKNAKVHGLPRQITSAATKIRKVKAGQKKNPITVASSPSGTSPSPFPPPKNAARLHKKLTRIVRKGSFVVTASEGEEEDGDDDYKQGSDEGDDNEVTIVDPPATRARRHAGNATKGGEARQKVADVVSKGSRIGEAAITQVAASTKPPSQARPVPRMVRPVVEIPTTSPITAVKITKSSAVASTHPVAQGDPVVNAASKLVNTTVTTTTLVASVDHLGNEMDVDASTIVSTTKVAPSNVTVPTAVATANDPSTISTTPTNDPSNSNVNMIPTVTTAIPAPHGISTSTGPTISPTDIVMPPMVKVASADNSIAIHNGTVAPSATVISTSDVVVPNLEVPGAVSTNVSATVSSVASVPTPIATNNSVTIPPSVASIPTPIPTTTTGNSLTIPVPIPTEAVSHLDSDISVDLIDLGPISATSKRHASPHDSEPPHKRVKEDDVPAQPITLPQIKLEGAEGATAPVPPHMAWYAPPSHPSQPPPWYPPYPMVPGTHAAGSPVPDGAMDASRLAANPHPWFVPPQQAARLSPVPETFGSEAEHHSRQSSVPPSQPWDATGYPGYYPPPGAPLPYMSHPSMQDTRQPPAPFNHNPYYTPPYMYSSAPGVAHYPPPTGYPSGAAPGYGHPAQWHRGPVESQGGHPGAPAAGSSANQG
ncbi:hypothetical protein H0H93_007265 [Arthromyces matolae]|nr:hypothetical protein H0H93_007265 [Arthromyces matolae]